MLKNTYILRILSHTNRCGGEFNDHYEIHQIGQSAPNFPLGKYHIDKLPFARIRLLAESGSAADGLRRRQSISIYDLSIINQFQSIVEQADDSTTKSSKQLELISI